MQHLTQRLSWLSRMSVELSQVAQQVHRSMLEAHRAVYQEYVKKDTPSLSSTLSKPFYLCKVREQQ